MLIDPRDKGHQDPAQIDFTVPRRAQYLHSVWKKHQDAVFWVDINLAIQKGLTFYQTRSNAIILQRTLPAYCIPKVVRLKTGEVLYEKSYISPRPPPKISLRQDHDWTRGNVQLGSTVEQQPVGKIVRQSQGELQHETFSQLTQTIPKPICDRSGKPDNLSENTRVEQTHDGSGQPDERNSSSVHTVKEQFAPEDNRDIALFNTDNEFNRAINEEDIDFNIPGLPHSAVKQLHGASVRDLIQKTENHPHPTRTSTRSSTTSTRSQESKDMTRDVGNIELCELLDVEPKSTVQSMSILLGRRHRLLHVRALLAKRNGGKQEICPVHHGSPLDSQLLYQERATPREPLREEARGSRVLHREFPQEEMQEEKFLGYSRPVHPR